MSLLGGIVGGAALASCPVRGCRLRRSGLEGAEAHLREPGGAMRAAQPQDEASGEWSPPSAPSPRDLLLLIGFLLWVLLVSLEAAPVMR